MSPLLFPGRAPCPPCGGPTHLTHVVTHGALAGQGRCGHLVLGGDRLHRGFLGVQGRAWEQERNTSLQEAEEGRGKTRWRMGKEGWGRGAVGHQVASPVLHSQVSRAELRRTPRMGQSPVRRALPQCPEAARHGLEGRPPVPYPLTSCLSSLLSPRAWDSRALPPNRDWATEEASGRLGGGWPGPRRQSQQPTPPQRAPGPAWAPGAGHLGRTPQGTLRVSRRGVRPRRGSWAPPLPLPEPRTLAFLSG